MAKEIRRRAVVAGRTTQSILFAEQTTEQGPPRWRGRQREDFFPRRVESQSGRLRRRLKADESFVRGLLRIPSTVKLRNSLPVIAHLLISRDRDEENRSPFPSESRSQGSCVICPARRHGSLFAKLMWRSHRVLIGQAQATCDVMCGGWILFL